jgi:hypothetical protein
LRAGRVDEARLALAQVPQHTSRGKLTLADVQAAAGDVEGARVTLRAVLDETAPDGRAHALAESRLARLT